MRAEVESRIKTPDGEGIITYLKAIGLADILLDSGVQKSFDIHISFSPD